MQSAESAHGGLQKVTVHGSTVKILVCSSFVWYIWLRAKNCLKWGKIYIALEMLFAGEGGGLGYRIQDASEHDAFLPGVLSFSFFFPESLSSGAVSSLTNYESRKCSVFISEQYL